MIIVGEVCALSNPIIDEGWGQTGWFDKWHWLTPPTLKCSTHFKVYYWLNAVSSVFHAVAEWDGVFRGFVGFNEHVM